MRQQIKACKALLAKALILGPLAVCPEMATAVDMAQAAGPTAVGGATTPTADTPVAAPPPAAPKAEEEESGILFAPDDEPLSGQTGGGNDGTTRKIKGTGEDRRNPLLGLDRTPKLRSHGHEDGLFGAYRVRVAMAKPKFSDRLQFYDKLYGDPAWYPQLRADWFAWDWYVTFGISLNIGYYTADGHAASATANGRPTTSDQITKDTNAPTTLTLVPMQAAVIAEFTPFNRKWLVLEGWAGLERVYFQEVRSSASSSRSMVAPLFLDGTTATTTPTTTTTSPSTTTTTTPTTTTTTTTATTTATPADNTLTNKGFLAGRVLGVAANIRMNSLDETSAQSLRGSMGIGSIYVSPFIEKVLPADSAGLTFARTVMGIGFTFETVY